MTVVKAVSVAVIEIDTDAGGVSWTSLAITWGKKKWSICAVAGICRLGFLLRWCGTSWQANVFPPWNCEPAGRDGQASVLCKSWAAWPYIIHRSHHEEVLHPLLSLHLLAFYFVSLSSSLLLNSSAAISHYKNSLTLFDSNTLNPPLTRDTWQFHWLLVLSLVSLHLFAFLSHLWHFFFCP